MRSFPDEGKSNFSKKLFSFHNLKKIFFLQQSCTDSTNPIPRCGTFPYIFSFVTTCVGSLSGNPHYFKTFPLKFHHIFLQKHRLHASTTQNSPIFSFAENFTFPQRKRCFFLAVKICEENIPPLKAHGKDGVSMSRVILSRPNHNE